MAYIDRERFWCSTPMADRSGGDGYGVDPQRRGLLTHCYRMLGSVREAEHLVDRTVADAPDDQLLAAATRSLLAGPTTFRPLPSHLTEASANPEGRLSKRPEITWLEPIPDHLVDGPVGLELVAALQYLPPAERAAYVLHEVDQRPVADVAAVLDVDTAELNRLLADARVRFQPEPAGRPHPDPQALLGRYARAFQEYDVSSIVELFDPDAIWEMPPFTSWFKGAKAIGRLISAHCPAEKPGDQVLVPVLANGQHGFAVYMRDPVENVHRAFQLQVLTLTMTGIVHAVAFFDLSLFETFELPELFTGLQEAGADRRPRASAERRRQDDHHSWTAAATTVGRQDDHHS